MSVIRSTINKEVLRDFIFSFLLILPTFYTIPHYLFLIPLLWLILAYKFSFNSIRKILMSIGKKNLFFVTVILFLMLANYYILGYSKINSTKELIPYFTLYFLTIIYAFFINNRTKVFLIIFIVVEASFVLLESILGFNTIFLFHPHFRNDLLFIDVYSARPFGLSSGIITCSYKLFIGLLLLYSLNATVKKKNIFKLFEVILLWAILINYSRSIILGTAFFIFLNVLKNFTKKEATALFLIYVIILLLHHKVFFITLANINQLDTLKIAAKAIILMSYYFIESFLTLKIYNIIKSKDLLSLTIIIFLAFAFVFPKLNTNQTFAHNIFKQVIGRTTQDVMSYRDIIFKKALKKIKEDPLVGNNSHKYYIYLDIYGKYEHLHNSFLTILVNHGIIIFFLYILFLYFNIDRFNFIYILPIFVVSLTQYFIFWGISFADIIFVKFLLFNIKKKDE